MQGVCSTCLSTDRNVNHLHGFSIKNTLWEWFDPGGSGNYNVNLEEFRLCWECRAMLKKVNQFKRQVFKAQQIRLRVAQKRSQRYYNLSKLSFYSKNTYDRTYQHHESTNGLHLFEDKDDPETEIDEDDDVLVSTKTMAPKNGKHKMSEATLPQICKNKDTRRESRGSIDKKKKKDSDMTRDESLEEELLKEIKAISSIHTKKRKNSDIFGDESLKRKLTEDESTPIDSFHNKKKKYNDKISDKYFKKKSIADELIKDSSTVSSIDNRKKKSDDRARDESLKKKVTDDDSIKDSLTIISIDNKKKNNNETSSDKSLKRKLSVDESIKDNIAIRHNHNKKKKSDDKARDESLKNKVSDDESSHNKKKKSDDNARDEYLRKKVSDDESGHTKKKQSDDKPSDEYLRKKVSDDESIKDSRTIDSVHNKKKKHSETSSNKSSKKKLTEEAPFFINSSIKISTPISPSRHKKKKNSETSSDEILKKKTIEDESTDGGSIHSKKKKSGDTAKDEYLRKKVSDDESIKDCISIGSIYAKKKRSGDTRDKYVKNKSTDDESIKDSLTINSIDNKKKRSGDTRDKYVKNKSTDDESIKDSLTISSIDNKKKRSGDTRDKYVKNKSTDDESIKDSLTISSFDNKKKKSGDTTKDEYLRNKVSDDESIKDCISIGSIYAKKKRSGDTIRDKYLKNKSTDDESIKDSLTISSLDNKKKRSGDTRDKYVKNKATDDESIKDSLTISSIDNKKKKAGDKTSHDSLKKKITQDESTDFESLYNKKSGDTTKDECLKNKMTDDESEALVSIYKKKKKAIDKTRDESSKKNIIQDESTDVDFNHAKKKRNSETSSHKSLKKNLFGDESIKDIIAISPIYNKKKRNSETSCDESLKRKIENESEAISYFLNKKKKNSHTRDERLKNIFTDDESINDSSTISSIDNKKKKHSETQTSEDEPIIVTTAKDTNGARNGKHLLNGADKEKHKHEKKSSKDSQSKRKKRKIEKEPFNELECIMKIARRENERAGNKAPLPIEPEVPLPLVKFTIVNLNEEQILETRELDREAEVYKNRAFKCEDCIVGFAEKKQLAKHIKEKHSQSAGKLKCPVCKVRLNRRGFWKLHVDNHYRSYKCRQCDFQHHRRYQIDAHVVKEHDLKPSPVCLACDIEFDSTLLLINHYQTTHIEVLKFTPEEQSNVDTEISEIEKDSKLPENVEETVQEEALECSPEETVIIETEVKENDEGSINDDDMVQEEALGHCPIIIDSEQTDIDDGSKIFLADVDDAVNEEIVETDIIQTEGTDIEEGSNNHDEIVDAENCGPVETIYMNTVGSQIEDGGAVQTIFIETNGTEIEEGSTLIFISDDQIVHGDAPECEPAEVVIENEISEHDASSQAEEDPNIMKCVECNTTFDGNAHCRAHMQFAHTHLAEFAYCRDCDVQFSSVDKYHRHLENSEKHKETGETISQTEEDPNIMKCVECNTTFDGNAHCRAHMQFAHTHLAEFAYCRDCDVQFSSVDKYHRHLDNSEKHKETEETISQAEEDPNIMKCVECNTTFEGNAHCRAHMQFAHTHLAEFAYCRDCDVQFSSVDKYHRHLDNSEKHKETEETMFDCGFCNSKFATKDYLLGHIMRSHRLLSHTCAICNKGFSDANRLKDHIQYKHPDAINAPDSKRCQICSEKFVVRSDLLQHIRSHTVEKPFACEKCDKRFAVKALLNKHTKKEHLKYDRKD